MLYISNPLKWRAFINKKINRIDKIKSLSVYADNASAIAGGLRVDDIYKTAAGELKIVV